MDWNEDLAQVAVAYSEDMCARGFFDHADPEGRRAKDRLDEAGIAWVKVGENLARGDSLIPEKAGPGAPPLIHRSAVRHQ